ncbi:MAG: retroviral-like aspartic protease family protein [Blastocatellia bacterium]
MKLEKSMGEVKVKVKLSNAADIYQLLRGQIKSEQVRACEIEAVVDTGAVNSVIPREIAEKLELAVLKKQHAKYANAFTEEVDIATPILVEIEGRTTTDEPFILGDEVLIGQTVLEKTDLLVDCLHQRVIPNPEHPNGPVMKIR